jgi:hypothetical protein
VRVLAVDEAMRKEIVERDPRSLKQNNPTPSATGTRSQRDLAQCG